MCLLQITSAQITKLEELWKENPEATLEGERERVCYVYYVYFLIWGRESRLMDMYMYMYMCIILCYIYT